MALPNSSHWILSVFLCLLPRKMSTSTLSPVSAFHMVVTGVCMRNYIYRSIHPFVCWSVTKWQKDKYIVESLLQIDAGRFCHHTSTYNNCDIQHLWWWISISLSVPPGSKSTLLLMDTLSCLPLIGALIMQENSWQFAWIQLWKSQQEAFSPPPAASLDSR